MIDIGILVDSRVDEACEKTVVNCKRAGSEAASRTKKLVAEAKEGAINIIIATFIGRTHVEVNKTRPFIK